jgi:hypothetical protein
MLDKKKTSMRATTSDMKYRLRTQNDWRSPLLKRSPTAERISRSLPPFYQDHELTYHQLHHGEPQWSSRLEQRHSAGILPLYKLY